MSGRNLYYINDVPAVMTEHQRFVYCLYFINSIKLLIAHKGVLKTWTSLLQLVSKLAFNSLWTICSQYFVPGGLIE